jgi:uncharacterized membrane protein YtjA (UPF0391 family)
LFSVMCFLIISCAVDMLEMYGFAAEESGDPLRYKLICCIRSFVQGVSSFTALARAAAGSKSAEL